MVSQKSPWNTEAYQSMALAYTRHHVWIKRFTFFSTFTFLLTIASSNIFNVATSTMLLFACVKAWQSSILFKNATEPLKYKQGLSVLGDSLKWQTIGLGVGFAILFLVYVMFATMLFFIILISHRG